MCLSINSNVEVGIYLHLYKIQNKQNYLQHSNFALIHLHTHFHQSRSTAKAKLSPETDNVLFKP